MAYISKASINEMMVVVFIWFAVTCNPKATLTPSSAIVTIILEFFGYTTIIAN